jgi:hypothetical protein
MSDWRADVRLWHRLNIVEVGSDRRASLTAPVLLIRPRVEFACQNRLSRVTSGVTRLEFIDALPPKCRFQCAANQRRARGFPRAREPIDCLEKMRFHRHLYDFHNPRPDTDCSSHDDPHHATRQNTAPQDNACPRRRRRSRRRRAKAHLPSFAAAAKPSERVAPGRCKPSGLAQADVVVV